MDRWETYDGLKEAAVQHLKGMKKEFCWKPERIPKSKPRPEGAF